MIPAGKSTACRELMLVGKVCREEEPAAPKRERVGGSGSATCREEEPAAPKRERVGGSGITMHKPVHAANLPKPVGPYSPGMGFERLIFVSGQGATDPATGELAGHDVLTQTEQCLKNLQAILK